MPGQIGGKRPGAGRKRGVPNRVTLELKEIARQYTEEAVLTLAEIMRDDSAAAAARVHSAETLLAYGHGKPKQMISGDPDAPIRTISRIELVALEPLTKDDGAAD